VPSWRLIVWLGVLAGCSGGGPLETGDYRFAVTSGFWWGPEPFVAVEADGRFMGRSPRTSIYCGGVLDPREHDRLTEALNDAGALWRDDELGGDCADEAVFHFYVATPDEEAWDVIHEFVYGPCERWSAPMTRLLEQSFAPIDDHAKLDLCAVEAATR
jgi:hypothetical protein